MFKLNMNVHKSHIWVIMLLVNNINECGGWLCEWGAITDNAHLGVTTITLHE